MLLEAEECYKAILRLGFHEPDIFIDYAELLLDIDLVDQAIDMLHEGIKFNSDSAELHAVLSGYLFSIDERDEAFGVLTKGMEQSDTVGEAIINYFPHLMDDIELVQVIEKFKP